MGLEMDRWQRWFVGVVLPVAFIGLTFLPWLVVRSDLPDPIATHFALGGEANGSMPVWGFLVVQALFTVPSSLVLLWAAWRPSATLGVEAAIATFVGWLLSAVGLTVMLANRNQAVWQDAALGAGAVAGSTCSAVGAAVPVALLVRRTSRDRDDAPLPGLPLTGSERAAWFGRARSHVFAALSVALVAAGTMLLFSFGDSAAPPGFVLLAVGLVLVSFVTVSVAVGEHGIRVRAGALHWPQVHLALDEIEAARSVDWKPLEAGLVSGWGYRGSLRLIGRAGWVLRAGPALELDLTRGRRFVVTVDDANEAAAVLNGLLARTR